MCSGDVWQNMPVMHAVAVWCILQGLVSSGLGGVHAHGYLLLSLKADWRPLAASCEPLTIQCCYHAAEPPSLSAVASFTAFTWR